MSAAKPRAQGLPEADVCVALGSNLGDREAHLRYALASLAETPGIQMVAVSDFHETEPVGPPGQRAYLNAAVRLLVSLSAPRLLARLHEIEAERGRLRGPVRNAPRTLDLDLLFYGAECIDRAELTIPHPRLHERAFVLEPLLEVAPDFRHPILGESVAALAARLGTGEG